MHNTGVLVFALISIYCVFAGPCQLGTYVGNPNGNDPNAMAGFEQHFDNFTRYMGIAPTYMNSFVDDTANWSDWSSNAGWSAWSWSLSNRSKSLTPVIGLPMNINDWTPGYEEKALEQIVAGDFDDVFTGVVNQWVSKGYTTLHFRLGWEADGNWYTWSWNGNTTEGNFIYPLWVKAWRHIATLLKSVPGAKVYCTWNPTNANWSPIDITAAYPGDDVVDVIGLDLYSTLWPVQLYDWALNNGTVDTNISVWAQNPVNREHFWNYPAANQWVPESNGGWGLVSHLNFAKLHNKPIAFCESGVGVGPGYPDNGIMDDGVFPTYVAQAVEDSGLECLYIDIWDVNVGDGLWQFSDGSKPNAGAAWKKAFGA